MKLRNFQRVIFSLVFILFAHCGWAEEWIPYEDSKTGARYYEKNSIKQVENNIVRIWTIKVYNKEGKAKDFYMLTQKGQAPQSADMLNLSSIMVDLDCNNNKFKLNALTIYDRGKKAIFSAPESMFKWNEVVDNTSSGKLKNKICKKK